MIMHVIGVYTYAALLLNCTICCYSCVRSMVLVCVSIFKFYLTSWYLFYNIYIVLYYYDYIRQGNFDKHYVLFVVYIVDIVEQNISFI